MDPVRYLAGVLPILSRKVKLKDIPLLLPAPWKAAHPDVAAAIAPAA